MTTQEELRVECDLRKYDNWISEKARDSLYTAKERVEQAEQELASAKHSLLQVKRSCIEQAKLRKLEALEKLKEEFDDGKINSREELFEKLHEIDK